MAMVTEGQPLSHDEISELRAICREMVAMEWESRRVQELVLTRRQSLLVGKALEVIVGRVGRQESLSL